MCVISATDTNRSPDLTGNNKKRIEHELIITITIFIIIIIIIIILARISLLMLMFPVTLCFDLFVACR